MKRVWNPFCKLMACLALCAGTAFGAQALEHGDRIDKLDELTFQEMLYSVDLGNKSESELIKKFQQKEGINLRKNSYPQTGECDVEFYRNKEVLLITIPANVLFSPNSTELTAKGIDKLRPILRYLRQPDMYRVLITMHTDNTGSEYYREKLTQERVDAVFDWFEERGANTTYLFPYAMSDDIQLKPNDTMDNRKANRRLEIYLVPGEKMLSEAKKGKIAF